jgi:SRSO17 transposase
LQQAPYTPEKRLAGGKQDRAFHTKPQLALTLVERAQAAGIPFKAIVADCAYGDNPALEKALLARHLPHTMCRYLPGARSCAAFAMGMPNTGGRRN